MDKFNTTDGTGHNMGALYWQLNDIWEGCSWASVEITGRWRMFHYYARKAFAPVLASPYKAENGDIVTEIISDAREEFVGLMRVRVVKVNSTTPLIDESVPVLATFMTSTEAHRISASKIQEVGCGDNTIAPCIVYVTLPNTPDNFLYIDYPKDKQFISNPNLRVTNAVLEADGKTVSYTLNSDSVAQFVFINLKEESYGKFSDNGFLMIESQKNMTYTSRDPITLARFTAQLDIVSLYDVTLVA
jgi:beta-mannosidase